MSLDRFTQAALDLVNRGPVSVPMLGAEFVKRRLLDEGKTIGHAYAIARATLDDLVGAGRAKVWPGKYVYTLPDSTPVDHPATEAIHKKASALEARNP